MSCNLFAGGRPCIHVDEDTMSSQHNSVACNKTSRACGCTGGISQWFPCDLQCRVITIEGCAFRKTYYTMTIIGSTSFWNFCLLFYNHQVFFKNNEKSCQLLRTPLRVSIFMGSSGARERFSKGNPIVPSCLWQESGILRQLARLQTQAVPWDPQVCLENTVHGDFLEQLPAHDSGLRGFPVPGAMT